MHQVDRERGRLCQNRSESSRVTLVSSRSNVAFSLGKIKNLKNKKTHKLINFIFFMNE
jgi:hypothetical protein